MVNDTVTFKPGDKIDISRGNAGVTMTSMSDQTVSMKQMIASANPFITIIQGFEYEFKTELISGRKGNKIKKLLDDIQADDTRLSPAKGEFRYTLLQTILTILRDLKAADHQGFEVFRKHLQRESKGGGFWGFIFELLTASNLINKEVEFTCGVPDFIINHDGHVVNIECGSIQPQRKQKPSSDPVHYINKSLYKKKKGKETKDYANNSSILMLDLTSLVEWRLNHGINTDPRTLYPDQSNYAAIIFTVQHLIKENGTMCLEQIRNRKDYDLSLSHVKSFLDSKFPIEETVIHNLGGMANV